MAKKKATKPTKDYNRIKEVLEEKGLTQVWLADQLQKDFKTVTRYVNNHRQPSIETLFEIGKVLRVSPKELLKD